ncbi:MAG: hypothetical protein WC389_10375 [Lutibacter sp.]|jgi:hypothetical protein
MPINKIKKIKISNLISPHSGREVVNQFEIKTCDGTYFQSYSTIIVFINNNGKTYLNKDGWKCSNTTSKYRNQFLGETTKETQEKVDLGIYTLTNLN